MTTEEKARAYDEALKKAQWWLNDPQAIQDNYTIEDAIQNIFPVLEESDDDRIRESLISLIETIGEYYISNETRNGYVAWLKKQKELFSPQQLQEHLDMQWEHIKQDMFDATINYDDDWHLIVPVDECDLSYGDKVKVLIVKVDEDEEKQKDLTTENIYKHSRERMSFYNGQQKKPKSDIESGKHKVNTRDLALEAEIKRYTEEKYHETFGNGQRTLDDFDWEDIAVTIEETAVHFMGWKEKEEKQKEQKSAEWNMEDEQNLNVCLSYIKDEPLRSWLKDAIRVRYDKPVEWSKEDEEMLGKVLECIRFAEDHYQLEKEEANGVSVKLWLLDHIIPQPTQEWSEEDEKIRQSIIKDIEFERNYTSATTGKVIGKYNEQIAWLKALFLNHKKHNEDVAKLCSNEWSEKDEEMFDAMIDIISNSLYEPLCPRDEMLSWFKSLRYQCLCNIKKIG